jgi:hypothetical protein
MNMENTQNTNDEIEIQYTYEISSINEEFQCMEIVYKSEGLSDITVGTPLPGIGETVEDIVKQYEPILHWKKNELSEMEIDKDE